ncbi:hypothetical protein M514_11381 [Trichuris suis]|uniref:Uncharacterized protein n=1 Tax=Trichuris suis TaxID=68888 RepID=A0A085MSC6_9BILA|nr:hypothetical protein M514_11381 [Trichuris suis]
MRYSSGRAGLALSVTVDTFTIAELDVLVSPTLKRRVIPLRFVLNTCAIQVELLPLFRLTEGLSISVCVYELQPLVHCVETGQAEVVVRSWRMESQNRIDSPRRRIRFATVAGDGWYNEDLDLRWSVIAWEAEGREKADDDEYQEAPPQQLTTAELSKQKKADDDEYQEAPPQQLTTAELSHAAVET